MSDFLPFALPDIGDQEIEEVSDSLRSGWLTTGPKVQRFESDFAAFLSAKHALAVNSATSGLHLALEALGVGPGDKVITSVNTFTASAEVIRYLGADPVFVDIDEQSMNMDYRRVAEAVEREVSVKAIMPVHLAGQACEMDEIYAIASDSDLKVVEDAAHALPTSYRGKKVGKLGDVGVFSFYATKTLATGEGGMVVTECHETAERIRTMRLHGINGNAFDRYQARRPAWYYEVVAPGYKYNMPDLMAAIGIHQLAKLRTMRDRRQVIAERYFEAFADLPVSLPTQRDPDDEHAWHLFIIRLSLEGLKIDRDEFIDRMAEKGVGTSVHFIPLHLQPYWRDKYALMPEDFPVATKVFKEVVSLPIYSKMSDEDVERVISAVRSILERQRK